MAAVTRATTFDNASDANFRSWAQAVHDILNSGGWVQTADTGQINLATVSAPAATDTAQGYEIWRTDDAAGSLVNFYIKVEYGSGATSATRPAIWITIGWGSDGAGTLTGTLWTRTQVTMTTNPSGTPTIYLSAGAGRFLFWKSNSSSSSLLAMIISIERTRDASGAVKNEVLVFYKAGSGSMTSRVVDQNVLYPAETSAFSGGSGCLYCNTSSNPHAAKVAIGVTVGQAPGPTSPSANILGHEDNTIGAAGTDVVLTVYGQSVNYKVCFSSSGEGSQQWGQSGWGPLVRYD